MAFHRKRAGGNQGSFFKCRGKSWIKALDTDGGQAANQVKQDAAEQLARIRRGANCGARAC